MYHRGALLQSRLYTSRNCDSYGGVDSDELNEYWEYSEFRKTIQNEIARCEGEKNSWLTTDYRSINGKLNKYNVLVRTHEDFGGYTDWEVFSDSKGVIKISVRKDMKNHVEDFTAGAGSLNLKTGTLCRYYQVITA